MSVISKTLGRVNRRLEFRTVRRFARNQNGATAVEFGMVALPFLALMFAIIETAIIFLAGQTLETAVADSGRLLLTGQAQTAAPALNKDTFKTKVCDRLSTMFDCAKIYVDVKNYSTFSGLDLSKPAVDATGKLIDNSGYQPGGAGCIVVVRVGYQWPITVSLLEFFATPTGYTSNTRLIMATSVFRNEPFPGTGAC